MNVKKSIEVEVEFDFEDIADEISTSELVGELAERVRLGEVYREELDELTDEMKTEMYDLVTFEISTLDDEMKIEHLNKVFSKYTAAEIENLIPERP